MWNVYPVTVTDTVTRQNYTQAVHIHIIAQPWNPRTGPSYVNKKNQGRCHSTRNKDAIDHYITLLPMLSSSTTRIFIRTTTAIRLASSTSSSLQFLSNSTLFPPLLHASFKPLPSTSTTSFFSSFRTDHTMGTSCFKSVYDFTVKVYILLLFIDYFVNCVNFRF